MTLIKRPILKHLSLTHHHTHTLTNILSFSSHSSICHATISCTFGVSIIFTGNTIWHSVCVCVCVRACKSVYLYNSQTNVYYISNAFVHTSHGQNYLWVRLDWSEARECFLFSSFVCLLTGLHYCVASDLSMPECRFHWASVTFQLKTNVTWRCDVTSNSNGVSKKMPSHRCSIYFFYNQLFQREGPE